MCEQKEDVEGRGQDADQLNGGVPGRKESVARPKTEGNSFSRWVIFLGGEHAVPAKRCEADSAGGDGRLPAR